MRAVPAETHIPRGGPGRDLGQVEQLAGRKDNRGENGQLHAPSHGGEQVGLVQQALPIGWDLDKVLSRVESPAMQETCDGVAIGRKGGAIDENAGTRIVAAVQSGEHLVKVQGGGTGQGDAARRGMGDSAQLRSDLLGEVEPARLTSGPALDGECFPFLQRIQNRLFGGAAEQAERIAVKVGLPLREIELVSERSEGIRLIQRMTVD